MIHTFLMDKAKQIAKGKLYIGVFFVTGFLLTNFTSLRAETVVVHAHASWEMTDVVVQENMIVRWNVDKNDRWCFNSKLFPDGHTADGIPVEALKGYVYPGQPIGKLIGRIGDSGRMFPMGSSGSLHILPSEDGEFLYVAMNDDILGLYGKGFKDNTGEIIVKVTQSKETSLSSN